MRWKCILQMLCAFPWALITPNWFMLLYYDVITLENAISALCFVSDLIQFSQNKDVFWGRRTGISSVVKRNSSQAATVSCMTAFIWWITIRNWAVLKYQKSLKLGDRNRVEITQGQTLLQNLLILCPDMWRSKFPTISSGSCSHPEV